MADKPLRVLDLRDSPWVDGPGRTILQSASMVDSARCQIIVGAFKNVNGSNNAYLQEAIDRGLETVTIQERSAFDRRVFKQVGRAVVEMNIDIIHTHDFRSDMFGLWCAKAARLPLISTCHGWIANSTKGKIYTAIDRFSLRFFDHVITVSERMRRQLLDEGVRDSRMTVIQNALIISNYVPDRSKRLFRQQLDIADHTKLIANIGRLSPEKGQEIFLYAARELLNDDPDMCFVLIGIGPEQEKLEALVRQLDIQDKVVFAGYRGDMINIYNSVDLVVQSSSTEGMPNVILEALLMEVPVVASDVGGTAEVMQDGFSGKLIPADQLEPLVNGIRDWSKNREHYQAMARQGRAYVSGKFDHNRRVERLMDVYEKVVDDKKGRR